MLMTPSCYFPPLDGWSPAPARFQRWRPVLLPPVAPHGREWAHRRHDSCERSRGAGPRQAETSGFRVGDIFVPPITQKNTFSSYHFMLRAISFAGVRPAVFHKQPARRLARRPLASPPIVCFPSALAAPTLCSLLKENTSRRKKRTAASSTSRGHVPLELSRPLGASAARRASRHTLSTHREPHHRH
ncbi:ribonuclease HI [Trypanosoma cruzi]|nr:ribonuclease HI [Trypanosoma cruzi]